VATVTNASPQDPSVAETVNLELSSIDGASSVSVHSAVLIDAIPTPNQSPVKYEDYAHLRHVQPLPEGCVVDILIGLDCPDMLTISESRVGEPGQLFAMKTPLGWCVAGPVPATSEINQSKVSNNVILERAVSKMWAMEQEMDETKCHSVQEQEVLEYWDETSIITQGHYQVKIPWVRKVEGRRAPNMNSNRNQSLSRLSSLSRRLDRDSDLKHKYQAGIDELLQKGYAEMVPEDKLARDDGTVQYLPHHPVINPRKEKVRIVFDGSAGLNDHVHKGPDLTNQLTEVLLRFRLGTVAVSADVEAMYYQVLVDEDERDALRFLWIKDGQVVEYRMRVHVFGGVWSGSAANYALRRTADDHAEAHSRAAQIVKENFYVDDLLFAVSTKQEAVELLFEVKQLLSHGGFNLTKFVSNEKDVLITVPENDRGKSFKGLSLSEDEEMPKERALGVRWDLNEDVFTFDSCLPEKELTRRGMISVIASLFDPLGFAAPFTIMAKMTAQEAARRKLGWDDELADLERKWTEWLKMLSDIAGVSYMLSLTLAARLLEQ